MKKRVDLKNTEKAVKSKTGSFEKKRQIQFLQHLKRRLKKNQCLTRPPPHPRRRGSIVMPIPPPRKTNQKFCPPGRGGGEGDGGGEFKINPK